MIKFDTLTKEKKRAIVLEKISSSFEIGKDELRTLVDPSSISANSIEILPSLPSNFSLDNLWLLNNSDLELLYLGTYLMGGKVKFSSLPSMDLYFVTFEFPPISKKLTKYDPTLAVSGNQGLRIVNFLRVVNESPQPFVTMPSLTIYITVDGENLFKRSLTSLRSINSFNNSVIELSKTYKNFQSLLIEIKDLSDLHDYTCAISCF